MSNPLRYNIGDARLTYSGRHEAMELSKDKVSTLNLPGERCLLLMTG
jgi:hypothetical protein